MFYFIYLFQMLRSNLELLIYKTSMSWRCGAALDISTEELCTNSEGKENNILEENQFNMIFLNALAFKLVFG